MAADVILALADAITRSLNIGTYIDHNNVTQSFSLTFLAERVYATTWDREVTGLRVVVMPTAQTHEITGRNNVSQDTIRIQIGVQDEARPDQVDKIDDLVKLVGEIKSHVKTAQPSYMKEQNITLIGIEHDPVWDQEHLLEHHQFRSAPTFVFREAGRL